SAAQSCVSRHLKCNRRGQRRAIQDVTRPKLVFEEVRLGNKGRWEYLRAIYDRYRAAGREVKQVILNEFCVNTGYHRKYAIRLLNGAPPRRGKVRERRRGLTYSQET